jgi:alkylation response protein AidB-like acyl-CoA dehydrogenase
MQNFYELDETALGIVERARKITREVTDKEAPVTDREGRFPRASIKALGEAGLLGLSVPKKHGGLEAGPRTFVAVGETLARSCGSVGMVYVMHVCATNVIAACPPEKGEALLKEIAAGKHLSTLAFSEKGSRSHFWAPVSRESSKNGKSTLSAEKSWVTSAGDADSYIVSTLASDGKTPVESTLFHVAKGARGLGVSGPWDGLGLRGNGSAPMALKDVEVGARDRVSAPGKGFDTMMGVVLPWFQLGSATISVGLAESALEATAAHLNAAKFEHLGAALSSLPNLRANVAKMRVEIDRSRAHLAYVVKAMEKPGPHTMPAVLAAKCQAAEMALEVTDLAMRTCGGAAFSKQLPIERAFRDARAASVMAPTTDVLRDFIGKAVLGLPLF